MLRLLIISMLLVQHQSTNKRIIAIYTKDANNKYYKEQLSLLSREKAGLQERDIVTQSFVLDKTTASLFKKKDIEDEFTIILTGKDGGEKFRSNKVTSAQKFYEVIDVMPMRKSEVKTKNE